MKLEEYRQELYNEYYKQSHYFQCNEDEDNDNCINKLTEKLFIFLEDKSKALQIFEKHFPQTEQERHQYFWELLVGIILSETGLNIKRDFSKSAPDYYFEHNNIKYHIEAKAPTEGSNKEFQARGISSYNSTKESCFEDGIINPRNNILRFTSTINEFLKPDGQLQGFYKQKTINPEKDKMILAINGNNAVKNKEDNKVMIPLGHHIGCALFGYNGNSYINSENNNIFLGKEQIIKNTKDNGEKVKIRNDYFCPDNDTPLDGIIYSNINTKTFITKSEIPYIFIRNPEKEDISSHFTCCDNII